MRFSLRQRRQAKPLAAAVCLLCSGFPAATLAETLHCGRAPYSAPSEVAALVSAMQPAFLAFPVFGDILMNGGLELCVAETLVELQGYFEPDTARVVINGSAPIHLQQAVLIHELWHVQQQMAGVCPAPDLSMRENARAVFAMEADASAISILVAWALREAGDSDMWDALSAWPLQDDIADTFAAEMNSENDIAIATQAAFSQWYESQLRVDAYYYAACANYLDVEDSDHRLRTYEQLDPVFFDSLCHLPNGDEYSCSDPR
jgi:hypothetical protein